jgi:hypothetical protein
MKLAITPAVLPSWLLSIGSRGGEGGGSQAYSFIGGVIDTVETFQEGISINEVKTLTAGFTELSDSCQSQTSMW